MNKIPKLRFPEFSGEWEEKRLENLGNISSGMTPLRSQMDYFENGKIPWIKTTDLNNGIINKTEECITEKALTGTPLKLLPINTILIAMYGGFNQIGRTGITKIEATINQAMSAIILKENYFPEYVLQYLNGFRDRWKEYAASSRKDPNITKRDVENFKISIPSLPEQEEIASFLSSVDSKIEKLEKKKELWEQYKKGVMQKIFSQELRFRDENGEDYPEWEEKELGEIISAKSSGISNNTLEENDGEYPIYGATGLIKNINFYEMDKDYIAIVKDGAGAGRTLYCKGKSSILATLQYLLLKGNNSLKFCHYLLITIDFTKYLVGSTIPHIYFKDYSLEKFNIPSLPEQTQIADFLSSIDSKIEVVEKELIGMKEFKKGLLQKMFV